MVDKNKKVKGLRIYTKYGEVEFKGTRLELLFILKSAMESMIFRNYQFINPENLTPYRYLSSDIITANDWPFNLSAKPFWASEFKIVRQEAY